MKGHAKSKELSGYIKKENDHLGDIFDPQCFDSSVRPNFKKEKINAGHWRHVSF